MLKTGVSMERLWTRAGRPVEYFYKGIKNSLVNREQ